jgi:hypothetical protein
VARTDGTRWPKPRNSKAITEEKTAKTKLKPNRRLSTMQLKSRKKVAKAN